jgi:hypothetical protein
LTTASTACPVPNISALPVTNAPDHLVDFRDLLLNPVDARWKGGTGSQPYGDLFSSVLRPYLEAQTKPVSRINEGIIAGLSLAQSGVVGALAWPHLNLWQYISEATKRIKEETTLLSSLYNAAVVHVSNLRIYNVDTVAEPLEILNVTGWNQLSQSITLKNGTRPLNMTVSILFAIGGDKSPLAMNNQLDLTLTIPSTTMSVGILAHMKEKI